MAKQKRNRAVKIQSTPGTDTKFPPAHRGSLINMSVEKSIQDDVRKRYKFNCECCIIFLPRTRPKGYHSLPSGDESKLKLSTSKRRIRAWLSELNVLRKVQSKFRSFTHSAPKTSLVQLRSDEFWFNYHMWQFQPRRSTQASSSDAATVGELVDKIPVSQHTESTLKRQNRVQRSNLCERTHSLCRTPDNSHSVPVAKGCLIKWYPSPPHISL